MKTLVFAAICTLAAGTAHALQVTPNMVSVGGTQIGVPITKDVMITNNGGASVKVMSITLISGQGPYTLQNVPMLPISLIQGTGFSFTVAFNPSMNGITTGSLSIVSNDANTPNITVPLSGFAGPAAISLDSGTIAFGGVNLGAVSPQNVVNVQDCDALGCGMGTTGFSDLTVTDISISGANAGDFVLDKKALPGVVPAQGMSPFGISFKPTATGNRTATVTVTSSAGNKTVSLFGTGTTSMLTVDKNTLDFGNVAVMVKSTAQNLTLGNSGTGTLQVMSVSFDDPSFALSGGSKPPFSISANGSAMVGVACTPMKLGAITGNATITTDVGMATVTLSCTGIAPMLVVNPNPVDFGKVAVGNVSQPIAVVMKNAGTDVLHINFIFLTGNDSNDFADNDQPNTPLTLQPGASSTFHVTFSPMQNMAEMAEIDIGSDDPLMPSVTVPLLGTGITAGIKLSPMPLDFGNVMVGQPSMKPLTIDNTGDLDVMITSISIGGSGSSAFSVDNKGPLTIATGQSAKVMVTYEPASPGAQMAVLTVTPMGLQAQSAQLKGTGVAPIIQVSPAMHDFGMLAVGAPSDPLQVQVHNGGTSAFNITSIAAGNSSFAIDMSATKPMVAPGGTTTFTVTYTPSGAMTDHSTVTIKVAESPSIMGSLSVSGTGVAPMPRPAPGGCSLAPLRRATPIPLALLGLLALVRLRFRRRG
jgi:hypothetical protein